MSDGFKAIFPFIVVFLFIYQGIVSGDNIVTLAGIVGLLVAIASLVKK